MSEVPLDMEEDFRINSMNIRNAKTGKILWEAGGWSSTDPDIVYDAQVNRQVLRCKIVSREVNFSSKILMNKLRLEQVVMLHGEVIEVWRFDFGFVIPNSTNSWQTTMEAAKKMLPREVISGNVVIRNTFYDGDKLIAQNSVRLFYI